MTVFWSRLHIWMAASILVIAFGLHAYSGFRATQSTGFRSLMALSVICAPYGVVSCATLLAHSASARLAAAASVAILLAWDIHWWREWATPSEPEAAIGRRILWMQQAAIAVVMAIIICAVALTTQRKSRTRR